MKNKNIIIWSSIIGVLGIVGYLVYKKIKKNQSANENNETNDGQINTNSSSNNNNSSNSKPKPKEEPSKPKEEPSDKSVMSQDLEKSISKIISKAEGRKAKKDYLQKTNSVWVKKWAWAIDNSKRAFTWGNKVWRTKTGEEVLNFNPIGVSMKTKPSGITAYWTPSDDTDIYFTWVDGNLKVGKVRAVSYDGKSVWFYLPDLGGSYSWAKANGFVRA